MLTSLGIHVMPMFMMYHIKWFTIHDQQHLPADQQRFANFIIEETWSEYLWSMVAMPIIAYLIWAVNFAMINFYLAKGIIDRRNY